MISPLIQPLTLGGLSFPVNIIQGPLAGVSCAPFRRLVTEYSQPAFSCTEMISCKTINHARSMHRRYLHKDPHEGPVCFQLSGNDPEELGQAVRLVTAHGADLVDLNCGCPVNKIRSRGAGSRLLADPARIATLIHAMKQNTSVPVSIKIRVDGSSQETYNGELMSMLNASDVDFVVIHGRHWTQSYDEPCFYDQIRDFVQHLKMPVIGNGDIKCLASLKKMQATGCAGYMVSRASVGRPWLIGHLIQESEQKIGITPSCEEKLQLLLRHVQALADLLQSEKAAVLQARTFAKYYVRDVLHMPQRNEKINQCHTLDDLCQLFNITPRQRDMAS